MLFFAAVGATMLGYGVLRGEHIDLILSGKLVLACTGLVSLMLPGLSAQSVGGAVLIVVAGIA